MINASSPHIYHSALVLAPKESIVWKLYEPYAHPFVKVVLGAPTLSTAAKQHSFEIDEAAWSPCNSFIAIGSKGVRTVDILDSTTLQHLQTLKAPWSVPQYVKRPAFSPDGCILSCASGEKGGFAIVSWDLQTGGIVSDIRHEKSSLRFVLEASLVYSADGKMLGLYHFHPSDDLFPSSYYDHKLSIYIFNVVTGKLVFSHSVATRIIFLENIWAHGKLLRFGTAEGATISIWEVRPTWGAKPTIVQTSPVPPAIVRALSFPSSKIWMCIQPLPTSYKLTSAFENMFQVWDAQDPEHLQEYECPVNIRKISLSPDGHFLACSSYGSHIYLWKESPTGYLLYGKIPPATTYHGFCFSQDGKSMTTWGDGIIQSLHIEDFMVPPSTKATKYYNTFVLELSLDKMIAVVAMSGSKVVMVFDLECGAPLFTIDTAIHVLGLGVVGSEIFVICEEYISGEHTHKSFTTKVFSWNLPTRDCVKNTRVSCEDGSGVVVHSAQPDYIDYSRSASVSSDSHLIGLVTGTYGLFIHNLSTGEDYDCGRVGNRIVQFSPDGCSVWCAEDNGTAIVRWAGDKFQQSVEQEVTVGIDHPPKGYPWASPHGCQVTNDWWILDADGRRLLMLPVQWRSNPVYRRWKGQFLALLHDGLQEPVILNLAP